MLQKGSNLSILSFPGTGLGSLGGLSKKKTVIPKSTDMEAVIPSKGVKLFSQMVKCLGKVGEELYLEAYPDKVCVAQPFLCFSLVLNFRR